jgi:carbon storage regulator
MLALSRNLHEKIRIGHDVIVQVIDIRGDKVRLGIEAPMDVPVHREEVYVQIFPAGAPLPKPDGVPFDE